MKPRVINLRVPHFFRAGDTGKWWLVGTTEKGNDYRICVGNLGLSDLRCIVANCGTRMAELVDSEFRNLEGLRDMLAQKWSAVASALKREQPRSGGSS